MSAAFSVQFDPKIYGYNILYSVCIDTRDSRVIVTVRFFSLYFPNSYLFFEFYFVLEAPLRFVHNIKHTLLAGRDI